MAELLLAASVARVGSASPDAGDTFDEDAFERGRDDKSIKLKRAANKPTDVYSWFEITLQEINLPSQTFRAVIEVHLFWQDYYLPELISEEEYDEFSIHNDYVPVKMSEIFENKVECSNSDPEFRYFKDTGTIYMMFVVECNFVERMELQRFPLDRQFLNMAFNAMIEPEIEGEGPWNWILEYPDWMPKELKKFDQKFAVRMLSSITEYQLLDPWVDFSGTQPLSIRLRVNRLPAYYFGNIIFPNFLIVAGCFSAFVIPRSDIADRLSVTVTLMLAAVAYRFIVTQMLPKVSYLTIMDYYILLGFVSVMGLIAENAIAGVPKLDKHGANIDLSCAILFGAMWLGVHIIALVALLKNEFMRVSWEEMDKIDSEEDEEAEFVFAETKFVTGNSETETGKADWKKYQNYNVLDRANIYAKANNIRRTNTFVQLLKSEQRQSQMQNLGKIYEENVANKETTNETTTEKSEEKTEETIEIYVPSKLKKIDPPKSTENQMSASIELGTIENKSENEAEKTVVSEPEIQSENEEENKSQNTAEYMAVNDGGSEAMDAGLIDENETDNAHGYNETVMINANVSEETNNNNNESGQASEEEQNDGNVETNENETEEYVQGNESGYHD